jgi:hypothetical protein
MFLQHENFFFSSNKTKLTRKFKIVLSGQKFVPPLKSTFSPQSGQKHHQPSLYFGFDFEIIWIILSQNTAQKYFKFPKLHQNLFFK